MQMLDQLDSLCARACSLISWTVCVQEPVAGLHSAGETVVPLAPSQCCEDTGFHNAARTLLFDQSP